MAERLRVLVLSGGGSPLGNNYSQYLQVRLVTEYFGELRNVSSTTLFGAGLRPDSPPGLSPDVKKMDGQGHSSFIRGEIKDNAAATRANVEFYFKEFLRGSPWKGQSFLLFVDNHGMPNRWDPRAVKLTAEGFDRGYQNNCIELWQPGLTAQVEQRCLSVQNLEQLLSKAIPAKVPINFVMSQCYSGAFHGLAMYFDAEGFPHRKGKICGFTATTEDTTSSGCTSFVSEETYDGYERRIAEALTGRSVLNGEKIAEPSKSLRTAHEQAMLLDPTKDVPLSSSDVYVLRFIEAALRLSATQLSAVTEAELEQIWTDLLGGSEKLGKYGAQAQVLREKLVLIEKLQQAMRSWRPEQAELLQDLDLKKISAARVKAQEEVTRLQKELDQKAQEINASLAPAEGKYLTQLGAEENLFEMLSNEDRAVAYERLSQADQSFQLYARFVDYANLRLLKIITWAIEKAIMTDVQAQTFYALFEQRFELQNKHDQAETLEGLLRRLETYMRVAAGVAWLAQKQESRALAEYQDLQTCEASLVF